MYLTTAKRFIIDFFKNRSHHLLTSRVYREER